MLDLVSLDEIPTSSTSHRATSIHINVEWRHVKGREQSSSILAPCRYRLQVWVGWKFKVVNIFCQIAVDDYSSTS